MKTQNIGHASATKSWILAYAKKNRYDLYNLHRTTHDDFFANKEKTKKNKKQTNKMKQMISDEAKLSTQNSL